MVGNGADVQIHMSGYDERGSDTSLALADGVIIEELLVAVRRIRFTPGSACEEVEDEQVDLEGPFTADLAGDGVLGTTPVFTAAAGSFCRVRLEYHVAGDGQVPADLAGASIFVRGTRADGVPFTVRSRVGDRVEIESDDGGFTLPAGTHPLHLAFAVGGPVAALSLDSLGAGPITIDDDENADQLDRFEEEMVEAIRLFRDADGDGRLSIEERAMGAELAD